MHTEKCRSCFLQFLRRTVLLAPVARLDWARLPGMQKKVGRGRGLSRVVGERWEGAFFLHNCRFKSIFPDGSGPKFFQMFYFWIIKTKLGLNNYHICFILNKIPKGCVAAPSGTKRVRYPQAPPLNTPLIMLPTYEIVASIAHLYCVVLKSYLHSQNCCTTGYIIKYEKTGVFLFSTWGDGRVLCL